MNQIGGNIVWNLDVDDKKYQAGLSKAKADAQAAGSNIDGIFQNMSRNISGYLTNAAEASRVFATSLLTVGAAGIGAVGFGVKMAADIETARQGFTTLLGSAKLADQAIAQIKRDAAATPFEFSNLVRANQMLTSVTKNAPQSEKLLLNVGKALSAAGKSSTELDNVIVNLQQIANTAHISELDVRQFGFAGINILELLADYYGTTKEAASEMVKSSKNAFADLEGAFAKAGENGGKFSRAFIDQAGTFKQLFSNFRDIVSQTAADIVTKTGIFDNVKNAVKGITTALIEFKPTIVQGLKDFFTFLAANLPIVAGAIMGALIPALAGVLLHIGLITLQLLPFIALGAALALGIQFIIEKMGGWEQVQIRLNDTLKFMGDVFNTVVKPAIDSLWRTIQSQLIPQLSLLWTNISPILIPALKILASVLGLIVLGAIMVVIEILKVLINWVIQSTTNFNNFVAFLKSIPETVRNAFASVYDAITSPFIKAYNKIKDVASNIKNAINEISPFVRHSPSLVDNVIKGVGIIKDQYASLASIKIPPVMFDMPLLESPTLSYATSPASRAGASASGGIEKMINIEKMEVRQDSDITDVARDLAFRIETSTGFTQNG